MTHVTGPRKEKIGRLASNILAAIGASGCTISEAFEAVHEVGMSLLKAALRPLEPFTCPTCPHPENLTPRLIAKIEQAVRKILAGRRQKT